MPGKNGGGGGTSGTKVVVEAGELRRIGGKARSVKTDVDAVSRAVSGFMGGLDRRGWDADAADSQWSAARGKLNRLSSTLTDQAKGLDWLAAMVDYFETGRFSGGVPFGLPLQDPVNSLTGNLAHVEVDLALPTRGRVPLAFARTYNSRDSRVGLFGPGWTSTIELQVAAVGDDVIIVLRGDGRRDLYQAEGRGYRSPFGVRAELSQLDDGGWRLEEPDGRWLLFSAAGQLVRLGDANGNGLHLERDRRGRVSRLLDDAGRALHFTYDGDGRLRELRDSTDRCVRYGYSSAGVLESVVDAAGATTRYGYTRGRLTTMTDPLGHFAIANQYDDDGRVLEQTDAVGGVSRFRYEGHASARVTTLTDPRGSTVTIVHDERGLVRSVVDALGGEVECTYTECGNRASLRDQNERLFTYEYDGQCRLARTEGPDGATESLTYDAVGNVVARADGLGNTWRFELDERRNLVASIDPEGGRTTFDVDAHGQVVRVVDPDGVTTSYEYNDTGGVVCERTADAEWRTDYDAAGRAVRWIDADGGTSAAELDAVDRPLRLIDATGAVTEFAYDAVGNLTRRTAPDGGQTWFEYDPAGRLVHQIDAAGGKSEFSYDANGNQTAVTDPAGFGVRYTYDALDRPIALVDARGGVWRKSYDAAGRLTEVVDARGGALRVTLDAAGRPTSLVDRTGATRAWAYDAAGRLQSMTDPSGAASRFEYDTAGRAVARVDGVGRRTELRYTPGGRVSSILDALGRRVQLAYDAAGRLHELTDALGGKLRLEYDRAGRVRAQTDRSGAVTHFEYDAADRLIAEIDALGQTLRYAYDPLGRLADKTEARGQTTSFAYDHLGHLTAVTDPLGHVTRYRYDARGFLVEHEDARGHVRRFGYDQNGWLTSTTDGLGRTVAITLDPNGNWIERVDPDGTTSSATYDGENRLLSVSSPGGPFLEIEYDPSGRPVRLLDALGATRFEYNAAGLPERAVDPLGREMSATYDAAGRRVGLSYFDGRRVEYAYDALDRLLEVTDWRGSRHRYTYDAGLAPIGLDLANGTGWRATRDPLGRVLEIAHRDRQGSPVVQFEYAYDAGGNVVSMRQRRDGDTTETLYEHDASGRLVRVRAGNDAVDMEYDAVGNRRTLRTPVYAEQATFDAADQLVALAVDGRAPLTFSYDQRGNLLAEHDRATAAQYTWDAAGRLAGVRSGDWDIAHRYDGQGRLYETQRTDATGLTHSTNYTLDLTGDPMAVLAVSEHDAPGPKFNVYGLGPLATEPPTGDGQRTFANDALGSPRLIFDERGEPVAWRDYDAWGTPTSESGPEELFGFTGAIEEQSVGLVHLGARWYQPERGRLLGRDPLGGLLLDPRTQNPYAYAHDNPVSLVDPSGLAASSAAPPFGPYAPPFAPPFGPTTYTGPLGPSPFGPMPLGPTSTPLPWWDWFSFPGDPLSAAVGGSTAWPGRRVADIDRLFEDADKSFSQATKQYQRSSAAYTRAMRPSRFPPLRLPLLRDARRGWHMGDYNYFKARGDEAFRHGKYLDDTARAMEAATPWIRPAAKALPVVSVAADAGFAFKDQWDADAGESTSTRVRHSAIHSGAVAGGALAGGAALAAGCTATGVGALAAAGCAAVGGWIGGKVGGVVGKGANWAVDEIIDLF